MKQNFSIGHRFLSILCLVMSFFIGANSIYAQNEEVLKTFTVCTINVDGLPQKIGLGLITLNSDGPGSEGTTYIGQYLAGKGYDLVGVSEDFNYNDELEAELNSAYSHGTYRGGIETDNVNINIRFNTDGLNLFWKNSTVSASNEIIDQWNTCYGKFTNGADELIRKGFRSYVADFGDGVLVDVFILHMDAETDPEDNAARADQLSQLAAYLTSSVNGRPKIIMGDTNCRYTRDDILGLLIEPINNTGRYIAKDAWVELSKGGVYPTLGSDALMVDELGYVKGEVVDKVIYINPNNGLQITPTAISFDKDGYVWPNDNTKALGDHAPLAVTFKATGNTYKPTEEVKWWEGETLSVDASTHEADYYLCNVGWGLYISDDTTPKVNTISNAPIWTLHSEQEGKCSMSTAAGSRLQMRYWAGWNAEIVKDNGATTFTLVQGTTRTDAYKFSNSRDYLDGFKWKTDTRYFGIAYEKEKYEYNKAETADIYNDWLIISETQKQEYLAYNNAYERVLKYANIELPSDLLSRLTTLLSATDAKRSTCFGENGYTAKLNALADDIEEWLETLVKEDKTSDGYNFSFETGDMTGWTCTTGGDTGVKPNKDNGANNVYTVQNCDGDYLFNTWNGNTGSFSLTHNQITGLEDGVYKLSALVGSAQGAVIDLTANGTTEAYTTQNNNEGWTNGNLEEISVFCTVNGGNLNITMSSGTWFKVDNFKLTKYNDYYDVTISALKFTTLCLPNNTVVPLDVEVYKATKFNDATSTVHLESVDVSVLPRNTGVVLYSDVDEATTYRFYLTSNVSTGDYTDNLLVGVNERTIPADFDNYYYYVLARQNDGVGFSKLRQYKDNGTANGVPANRAYLPRSKSEVPETDAKSFIALSFENEETTAIEVAPTEKANVQEIYGVDGSRRNGILRGINIVRMSDGSVRKIMSK